VAAEGGPRVSLSVVVIMLNELENVGDCVDAVRTAIGQRDDVELIVVDGGSTDGTVAVIERHMAEDPRVELLHNPRQIIPAALNIALAAARGRWLVRMDAHSTVEPSYVRTAVGRLTEGRWGGVGGRKDGVGTTAPGRAIAAALGSRFGVGGSLYHYGTEEQLVDHIPFGAYPTELVRELGGWDERLEANEDFEFDYRLRRSGAVLLFDPRLRISWASRQTVRSLYQQYRRYGAGEFDVARLHPASLRPRHLVPPLRVPYLATAVAGAVRRPRGGAALLAPYPAGLALATVRTARTLEDPAARAYLPAAFLAMHIGWGVGVWSRVLRSVGRRRVQG